MAKKSKNKNTPKHKKSYTRQTYKTARPSLRLTPKLSAPKSLTQKDLLLDFTDPIPTKKTVYRSEPVKQKNLQQPKLKPLQHGFKKPTLTKEQICKRRSERKEIIHALKKSGQSGQKTPNLQNATTKC